MTVKLDDDNENWMATVKLESLRERGWEGSLEDWLACVKALGEDPLDRDPPITSLPAGDVTENA